MQGRAGLLEEAGTLGPEGQGKDLGWQRGKGRHSRQGNGISRVWGQGLVAHKEVRIPAYRKGKAQDFNFIFYICLSSCISSLPLQEKEFFGVIADQRPAFSLASTPKQPSTFGEFILPSCRPYLSHLQNKGETSEVPPGLSSHDSSFCFLFSQGRDELLKVQNYTQVLGCSRAVHY